MAFLDDAVLAIAILVLVLVFAPGAFLWALLGIALWVAVKAWVLRSQFRRPAIGVEAMEGRVATALADLTPGGHVDLDGETWQAESAQPVRAGEKVRVLRVDGLTLHVAPVGVAGAPVREAPPGSVLLALARSLRRPR